MSTVARPSASDTVRTAFDFTVDKFPMRGPDNLTTPCYGLWRSDTQEFVGDANDAKGKGYVPHQTDDVVALVEACENVFDECEATAHFRKGHYVSLAPTHDYRRSIFGTADNVFPRLIIRGGFDRRAFSATLGYYRDACMNLSMLRTVSATHQKIRHDRNLRPNMDELILQFQSLQGEWQTLTNLIEGMQSVDVAADAFVSAVYGEPQEGSERSQVIHENRTRAIFKRLARERVRTGRDARGLTEESDFTVSAWEAYNAIQGYIQWEGSRSTKATDFDRIILASQDTRVLKAEKLALAAVAA
jgi:hypothetical protein